MPRSTHKKAGVTVIVAVNLKTKVIRPTIILAATATKVQLPLQLQ